MVAVHGGRGGVGVTFVATHLAAAFARRGSAILIDADPVFGDVAQALGAPAGEDAEPVHTFADAASLGDDLGPEQLKGALWRHASEVDVLLPPAPEEAARLGPEELRLVMDAAAQSADVVVVHLPRALSPLTIGGAEYAGRLLEIVTLDVVSFRATSRAMEAFSPLHLEGRVAFVVNKACQERGHARRCSEGLRRAGTRRAAARPCGAVGARARASVAGSREDGSSFRSSRGRVDGW